MNFSGIINSIKSSLVPLFESELHKLFGIGVASAGLVNGATTTAGYREMALGLGYAALVHIADLLKPKVIPPAA